MAKEINRSVVVLSGWQARFELPAGKGTCYSNAYLAFLRTITKWAVVDVASRILVCITGQQGGFVPRILVCISGRDGDFAARILVCISGQRAILPHVY